MAHSKNYQVHNVSHDKRTSSLHEKEKPMDTSEPANPQTIKQLCEITGVPYDAALNAFKAAHGDVEKALTFLTNPGNDKEMQDGSNQKAIQTSVVKNSSVKQDEVIDLTKDGNDRDEDLEKAIALSLQESHPSAPQGITAEEQDISRVLEASLNESKSSLKRKRGDPWMTFVDPVNPYERKRTEGTPVGFKNVGNTCWFSAVIQSLFHLPVFRKLVLNCELPAIENKESKDVTRLSFMHELRKLFALLIGSKRKYVDPTKAVEILKEALQYNGSESNPGNQQDVSEFTHKLLEWLEDTFKVETCAASSQSTNPVMELFFGQSKVEGVYEGKQFSNLEMFGAYPVQVQAYNNLYDSLEGGMARGRIEPANNVNTHQSDQEHWFTRLPAVLKFMLSRFHFNQATGRAEKIHERLNFDRVVYMDRYMETNKDIIRIRREEVKKLKEHRHLLKKSLESFTNYGSRHTHIKDILDSSLQFLRATSPLRDNGDVEMESDSTPSSPRSVGASTKAGLLAESRLASLRPAPRYVTESELVMTESCLTRWRKEVEQDVHDISKKISDVEQAISLMYDDDGMKKVPYRLHAVLVHEGQASGGHYWAYIYDPQEQQWRKFNDITVSEVTWEEVQKESLGGYRNVSAYGLMYVDASREGLVQASDTLDVVPSDLQDIVNEDNEKFEKEMVEWDEKKASPSPEDKTKMASTRSDLGLDSEASCAVSPYDQAPMIKITKATTDDDLDKVLSQMCGNETERVHQISRDHPPEGPRDVRLENIGIYLLRCGAPSEVIQWQILKQVNENMKNKADPSYGPLSKRATSHLTKESLGKLDVFDKWEEKYVVFQRVNSCFLTGLEHFHNQKFQEALPYLVHAYNLNHKLEDPDHPPQSMDENLLAYCRRICFLKVNDHALRLFESHSSVSKGLDLVGDLIVPCIPILMSSPHNDDREAVETMRQNWFGYLGSDIDDQRQKKLEDLLPLLTSDGHQEMRPPPIVRPTSSRDLCERFKKAMELVHANMAFSAKA